MAKRCKYIRGFHGDRCIKPENMACPENRTECNAWTRRIEYFDEYIGSNPNFILGMSPTWLRDIIYDCDKVNNVTIVTYVYDDLN